MQATECPELDYFLLEGSVSVLDTLAAAGLSSGRGAAFRPGPGLSLNLRPLDNSIPGREPGGQPPQVVPFPYGTLVLASIVNPASVPPTGPARPVRVYVRRAAFDQLTDSCGIERLPGLNLVPANSGPDTVLPHLRNCLQDCLQRDGALASEFTGHLVQAIHCHIAQVYGDRVFPDQPSRGGLARWQLRFALEQLDEFLERGRPPLARIARGCGLSVSHFSRAFTRSTGLSPTRWSRRRRVERAKELLRSTSRSFTDISQVCGFADPSHFSHQFSSATGTTAARWRAQRQTESGRR